MLRICTENCYTLRISTFCVDIPEVRAAWKWAFNEPCVEEENGWVCWGWIIFGVYTRQNIFSTTLIVLNKKGTQFARIVSEDKAHQCVKRGSFLAPVCVCAAHCLLPCTFLLCNPLSPFFHRKFWNKKESSVCMRFPQWLHDAFKVYYTHSFHKCHKSEKWCTIKKSFLTKEDHLRVIAHRHSVCTCLVQIFSTLIPSGSRGKSYLQFSRQTHHMLPHLADGAFFFHGWKPYINLLLNHTLHTRKSYRVHSYLRAIAFFGTRSTICFYFRVKHSYTFLTTEQQIGRDIFKHLYFKSKGKVEEILKRQKNDIYSSWEWSHLNFSGKPSDAQINRPYHGGF